MRNIQIEKSLNKKMRARYIGNLFPFPQISSTSTTLASVKWNTVWSQIETKKTPTKIPQTLSSNKVLLSLSLYLFYSHFIIFLYLISFLLCQRHDINLSFVMQGPLYHTLIKCVSRCAGSVLNQGVSGCSGEAQLYQLYQPLFKDITKY
jgi:hypothetical protein